MTEVIKNILKRVYKEEKNDSYLKKVFDIIKTHGNDFRDKNFFVNKKNFKDIKSDVSQTFLKYSPFICSNKDDVSQIKQKLFDYAFNNCTKCFDIINSKQRLLAIGNGSIDENGVMIIGMAAGFFDEKNKFTNISFPFKPSFYFAETSEMLRDGFFGNLENIYFTNMSKCAFCKNIMNNNDGYIKLYSRCKEIILNEIEVIKPSIIYVAGKEAYEFAKSINIKCEKIIHPSYFLFRKNKKAGIEYYKKLNNETF